MEEIKIFYNNQENQELIIWNKSQGKFFSFFYVDFVCRENLKFFEQRPPNYYLNFRNLEKFARFWGSECLYHILPHILYRKYGEEPLDWTDYVEVDSELYLFWKNVIDIMMIQKFYHEFGEWGWGCVLPRLEIGEPLENYRRMVNFTGQQRYYWMGSHVLTTSDIEKLHFFNDMLRGYGEVMGWG